MSGVRVGAAHHGDGDRAALTGGPAVRLRTLGTVGLVVIPSLALSVSLSQTGERRSVRVRTIARGDP